MLCLVIVHVLALCPMSALYPAGLLHWFTSPYIHRMVYHRNTGMVDLESLTVLARPRRDSFHVASVAYPQTYRPQATFQVSHVAKCLLCCSL